MGLLFICFIYGVRATRVKHVAGCPYKEALMCNHYFLALMR